MRPRTLAAPVLLTATLAALYACGTEDHGHDAPAGRDPVSTQDAATATTEARARRAGDPDPDSVAPTGSPGSGRLIAVYEPARDPKLQPVADFLEKRKVLDEIADYANARVKLPTDIGVEATSCDEANANYDAFNRQIRYCHEFAAQARAAYAQPDGKGHRPTAKEVDDQLVGFTNGIVFHELGHALINLYDLPVTGKEEDAVDQLSVLMLASGDEKHADYVIDTINAWAYFADSDESRAATASPSDPAQQSDKYADEHSLNEQRYFNWACWLYGSNEKAYASVVQNDENPDGVLPSSRAAQCGAEFKKIDKSWHTLLKPYLK
ncbi:DUF4344 domain-containing metallopeptidase [Streptomyces sp. NPDC048518]|uniref:DUF4344 domain-containing metallopeptidase n=1 Tax=Streptomyces sp. NPDC048518 TaxID=3155029 RepID=UPI0033E77E49